MAEEAKEEWEELPIETQTHSPDDDILESIVEVVDDEAPAKSREETESEEKETGSRYQRRINQLTAKQREEERARLAAEEEAQQLRSRLERLEQRAAQNQVNNFKVEYDSVKRNLQQAAEEGDTALQVELTEKLADMRAAARMADAQAANNRAQIQNQQQTQKTVAQESPPQEAMRWWNKNRWFNNPDHVSESATARKIDEQLDAEGWDKESPDYYKELDNRLQKQFPELYSTSSKPKPPIAPTKGTGSGGPNKQPSNDGRLRFTKQELAMAKALGITTEEGLREYAREIQTRRY